MFSSYVQIYGIFILLSLFQWCDPWASILMDALSYHLQLAKITVSHLHSCHLLYSCKAPVHKVPNRMFSIRATLRSHRGVFHTHTHVFTHCLLCIFPQILINFVTTQFESGIRNIFHLVPHHSVDWPWSQTICGNASGTKPHTMAHVTCFGWYITLHVIVQSWIQCS